MVVDSTSKIERQIAMATPTGWVSLDAATLREWRHRVAQVDDRLSGALGMLDLAATAFEAQGALYGAMLVEPGEAEALATVVAYAIGFPHGTLPDDFVGYVQANPPKDCLPNSFTAEEVEHDLGRCVWSRCLRRVVLEVPSGDTVSLSVEYFIELADEDTILLLAFTTPNVQQREEYEALFASIVLTVDIV